MAIAAGDLEGRVLQQDLRGRPAAVRLLEAQLAETALAPGEDHAARGDCARVVVAAADVHYLVVQQRLDQHWTRRVVLAWARGTQLAEGVTAHRVEVAVRRDKGRVLVPTRKLLYLDTETTTTRRGVRLTH